MYLNLGCYNRISFQRLDIWDQGASFVKFLVRGLFLVDRHLPSHCVPTWQRAKRDAMFPLFAMTLIPFWGLDPNYLSNTSPPNVITLGSRISPYEFWGWGGTNIESITVFKIWGAPLSLWIFTQISEPAYQSLQKLIHY